jgi:predicted RNA binding protein YcfA (HicA-like mRNA interferase family)
VKLPRDVSGTVLAERLARYGYVVTRQTGSHLRLTLEQPVQHHLTIPAHPNLKVGTLSGILREVGRVLDLDRERLLRELFG